MSFAVTLSLPVFTHDTKYSRTITITVKLKVKWLLLFNMAVAVILKLRGLQKA